MSEPGPSSPSAKAEPTRARSAIAYDLLRQRIVDGELRSGDHVSEAELAQALGLSRTPVREAIKLLQAEGLMEPSGGRGLIVATLSLEKAEQLFYMREAIEGLAARLAAKHASAPEIEEMAALLAQEAAATPDQPKLLLKINDAFHAVIHKASRNQYVLQYMQDYESAMILLRQMTQVQFSPSPNAHGHHLAIFNAIEREDSIEAENAMRQHIRFSRRKRLSLLEGFSTA